tara:strand:+ start:1118 stop:2008 length:891 start_codon:yes stop_codon:yes gene_type:complete
MEGFKKIKKAIIPVAGFGTRMLPATKAVAKELLPILDKPLIQIIIEEAVEGGIEEIILITRSGKEAIENHLDNNFELETLLKRAKKHETLSKFPNHLLKNINFLSIRQEKPKGLGDAIFSAKPALEYGEAFAIFLPDEFLLSLGMEKDFKKMMTNYMNTGNGQLLIEKVPRKKIIEYGVVDLNNKNISISKSKEIKDVIEKPSVSKAPSNFRIVGRYILPYEVIKILSNLKPGKNKEIQLTDAIKKLLNSTNLKLEANLSNSRIFDCGSLKGFLGANIALASKDKSMKKYLKEILS